MQSLKKINKKLIVLFFLSVLIFLSVFFGVNYFLRQNTVDNQAQPVSEESKDDNAVDINVITPQNVCYIEFEVKETPKSVDATIEKQFRGLNNENLPSTYLLKPEEKIIVFTHITNTGSTAISDLVVKDPLSSEFSNNGAKNLDQIVFSEFLSNPGSVCKYDTTFKFVECTLPNLNPQEIFDYSFVVTVKSSLISSSDVINVTRLSSLTKSILKYSSDSLKTPVKDESSHLVCEDKACVSVSGSGENECAKDDDCVYSTCEDRSCVEKSCDDGDCDNDCDSDSDCKEETHLECVSDTCKRVAGEGRNTCADNSDCYSTHLECKNASCVSVSGKGTNKCSTDGDCRLSPTVYSVPSTGTPFSPTVLFVIYLPSLFFATSLLLRIVLSRK